jgi:Ras-related protein Rab-1A
MESYKIIIIGDSSVGKTNYLTQYVNGKFTEEYNSTVGIEFKDKIIYINNKRKIRLQIWDSSGQERFKSLTKNYFRSCYAALFIFDVTNRNSFNNIKNWLELYNEIADKNSEKILIGNKIDLENKTVRAEIAKEFAKKNHLKYFEISVKEKQNINSIFEDIAYSLENNNNKKKKKILKKPSDKKSCNKKPSHKLDNRQKNTINYCPFYLIVFLFFIIFNSPLIIRYIKFNYH